MKPVRAAVLVLLPALVVSQPLSCGLTAAAATHGNRIVEPLVAFGPAPQDDDTFSLKELDPEFLKRVERHAAEKNWKGVFDAYAVAVARHRDKLVRPDRTKPVWCGATDHLKRLLSRLPPEAFAYYRRENDGKAASAYQRALQADDRAALARVAEDFFFSSVTDEILDHLAARHFEEGRLQEAVYCWGRLLDSYPDGDIPPALVAARLAAAACSWGSIASLDHVRRLVADRKIEGTLAIGGREMSLAAFLDSLSIPVAPAAAASARLPTIPAPERRYERPTTGVRNEIKTFAFDFGTDVPPPERRGRIRVTGSEVIVPLQYPYFPAATRLQEGRSIRDYVVATNGRTVIALNPSKTRADNPKSGRYWTFPPQGAALPPPTSGSSYEMYTAFTHTQIGCIIEGATVYATLYSAQKAAETDRNNQDHFSGPGRLVALDLPTGGVLWDTDEETLHSEYRKLVFYDKSNFAWSSPPLVRGDRLYVGVCTSPFGTSESYVVAIDRRTGRPLWTADLGFVAGRSGRGGDGNVFYTLLTLLAEEGGVLYAHSNMGTAAALHSVTGEILWLSRYPRFNVPSDPRAALPQREIRPASPPIVHRGRIYLLPQDQPELQVFDAATGERIELPAPAASTRAGSPDQWPNIRHMIGVCNDWLVLSGTMVHLLNVTEWTDSKGNVHRPLTRRRDLSMIGDIARSGRPTIDRDVIYIARAKDGVGDLITYPGGGLQSLVEGSRWQGPGEHGNLLVTGDYLVVSTAYQPPATPNRFECRLLIYTAETTLDREFALRLRQNPPDPAVLLAHARAMRANDRLDAAAASYLAFVRAAEGDPRHETQVREVKSELHGIYLQRGDQESALPGDGALLRAVESYRRAQDFHFDERSLGVSTRRLAETYERLANAKLEFVVTLKNGVSFTGIVADRGDAVAVMVPGGPASLKRSDIATMVPKPAPDTRELARHAIEEYQRLILGALDSAPLAPGSDDVTRSTRSLASERIRALVTLFGRESYEAVERSAQELLAGAKAGGTEALRKVVGLYPDSRAALEAYRTMVDEFKAGEDWRSLLSTLREIQEKYSDEWELGLQKLMNDSLERLKDWRRFAIELRKSADRFGNERMGGGAGAATVQAYADRRLQEIQPYLAERVVPLESPLQRLVTIEGGTLARAGTRLPTRRTLLVPRGIRPADFGDDLEFFTAGSTVELWNVAEGRKVWSARYPGGHLGAQARGARESGGIDIAAVLPGSPAEKAGLKPGDVLLEMNGEPARAETFDRTIRGLAPGSRVAMRAQRGQEALTLEAELAPWPEESAPAVVGAAFTRAYQLAVVWDDAAAALDTRTGQPGWVFRGIRPRCAVREMAVMDGSLLFHEHLQPDIARSGRLDASNLRTAEDLQSRIISLDDATGALRWIRSLPFDLNNMQNHAVAFRADYFGETAAALVTTFRGGQLVAELQTLHAGTGKLVRSLPLGNTILASAWDEAEGILYIIQNDGDRRLRAIRAWGPGADRATPIFEIALHPKYLEPNASYLQLCAKGGRLALLVPPLREPTPVNPAGRIYLFAAKGGQELLSIDLAQRHGRALMADRPPAAALDDDGTLFVHLVPASLKSGRTPPRTEARGFLAAFRVPGTPQDDPRLWESIAPLPTNVSATVIPCDSTVILVVPQGREPLADRNGSLALVYSAAEGGYLRQKIANLESVQDGSGAAAASAVVRDGRIFVQGKQGLEIHGPPRR